MVSLSDIKDWATQNSRLIIAVIVVVILLVAAFVGGWFGGQDAKKCKDCKVCKDTQAKCPECDPVVKLVPNPECPECPKCAECPECPECPKCPECQDTSEYMMLFKKYSGVPMMVSLLWHRSGNDYIRFVPHWKRFSHTRSPNGITQDTMDRDATFTIRKYKYDVINKRWDMINTYVVTESLWERGTSVYLTPADDHQELRWAQTDAEKKTASCNVKKNSITFLTSPVQLEPLVETHPIADNLTAEECANTETLPTRQVGIWWPVSLHSTTPIIV